MTPVTCVSVFQLADLSGRLYPVSHTMNIYREALLEAGRYRRGDGQLWGGRIILALSRHVTPEQVGTFVCVSSSGMYYQLYTSEFVSAILALLPLIFIFGVYFLRTLKPKSLSLSSHINRLDRQ